MTDRETWETLGRQLRIDSIRASSAAGSGHPTSSMSAADLMAVLLERYLRYDFESSDRPTNDHLVFSKGHASPLLYSMYRAAGVIEVDGHDIDAIDAAYGEAARFTGCTTVIVARTIKGSGISWVTDRNGMHGKALDAEHVERALAELGAATHARLTVAVHKPQADARPDRFPVHHLELPRYVRGSMEATRRAYAEALV